MIYYLFMPLDQQFDSGFGTLGDAFREAAERLLADKEYGLMLNRHLPICFLHRHAVELYLKSSITILHRRFRLPNPTGKHEPFPPVKVGDKWKPLHAIHSISILYEHLTVLLSIVGQELKKIAKTDFSFLNEARDWVKTIEESDASSTYFRYPVTREGADDASKSTMKKVEPKVLEGKLQSEPSSVCAFVVVDDEGNPVETFMTDKGIFDKTLDALRRTSDLLSGFHAAMRAEVAGGL